MKAIMILAAAGMAAGLSVQANAQGIPDACKADHRKFCADAKPDKVESCLRTHPDKISVACKVALKESQKK